MYWSDHTIFQTKLGKRFNLKVWIEKQKWDKNNFLYEMCWQYCIFGEKFLISEEKIVYKNYYPHSSISYNWFVYSQFKESMPPYFVPHIFSVRNSCRANDFVSSFESTVERRWRDLPHFILHNSSLCRKWGSTCTHI